jgi:hypothetical protein
MHPNKPAALESGDRQPYESNPTRKHIVFVQEPYLLQNKTAGITRTHRTYISNEDKSWAAIIIANDNIDAVLIKQLSDRDSVALGLRYKSIRLLAASMYLDITEENDKQIAKVDDMIQYSKGSGILIAMESDSRSTVRHDYQTNTGRISNKQRSKYYERRKRAYHIPESQRKQQHRPDDS